MKKTIIFSILAATAFMVSSCSKDLDPVQAQNQGECITVAQADVDDFIFGFDTKTAISNTGTFTWAKNDALGVWPTPVPDEPASQVQFKTTAGGAKSATFSGSGWGLLYNRKYYAYFPYKAAAQQDLVEGTYSLSQTQTANDNTSHLGANDVMYSSATAPEEGNQAHFQFHHFGSLLKLVITVPEESQSNKFTQVELKTAEPLFTQGYSFNPTSDEPVMTATSQADTYTLKLGSSGSGFVPVEGELTVWFHLAPVDLTGKEITVTAYDNYGVYSGTLQGADFKSGHARKCSVTVAAATVDPKDLLVDMGLPSGILWAKSNLTIGGLPLDEAALGDYYGWGELEPYYSTCTVNGETLTATWKSGYSSGYVQGNYNKDGTIRGTYTTDGALLTLEDDAAYKTLGEGWRIPSIAQFDELAANCSFATATVNGVSGIMATSNRNGNTLFFPANGYVDGNSKVSGYVSGSIGPRFWLADCKSADQAYQQLINMSSNNKLDHDTPKNKWRGTPIRPIYIPE